MGWLSSLDDAEGVGIQQLDFLEKVQREQQLMGNASANEIVVASGNQAKGVNKLLTAADDDDDDDPFERFAVKNDSDDESETLHPIGIQSDDPKPMCIDSAGDTVMVETGDECHCGNGDQVPPTNQTVLTDAMQIQIEQGAMASEHESHEKESAKVEDDAGTQTVEDKQLHHSMSSRDERPLDGIPHPHGEQQSPRHVTVNITDEHAGQTNLLNPNASRITSSEDFPNSICHPDAAHPMTVRACPVVSGKEQHPDPFLDCGRQGKEKASPALSHPREAGTLQERGSPVPLEEQLATLSASEVHSAQIVESANVSTGQNAQPEAALGFPIGVVVADVVENRNKDNAQGQGNPSPNVMPALAVRAMRPTESGKSNFNEMPCVSIDDPMCMWNSNRNTPRSMERVETLRQDPAGKDSSEARGCQGQMTEATDTRDDPSCPGLAVGPSYGECVKVPTFPPSSVPALQQASSRGVVSGTILTNALPKRSSGGCNRLQALVRTSSLAATQLSAPALLKSATYRKSADGGHPGRSPFPVQGPAKQANRHTAKLQGSNPTLASRLDDASTSRHSSFFQSGGHDLLKPTSIPTSSESARTVDPDPARSMDASSTRVKSGDPNSISLKQGERAGTTEMDHSTKVPVQPDPKTGALVGEDAPYQGRPPTSSQIVTNALQLAPPRRSGGTLRTATAQLAVQIQKTSQMLVDAQKMEMEALELQVRLAVHGNRLARLDNPIMLDAFQKLKQTADHFMSFEE